MPNIQCRCGEIELEVRGEPIAQFYCHCDDCQAVHGAAYVPEVVFRADDLQVVRGAPTNWALKRTPRVTCPACGTRLFADIRRLKLRGLNGALWPSFAPTLHMNCAFAVRPVVDALPHYARLAPEFGGPDERVDW